MRSDILHLLRQQVIDTTRNASRLATRQSAADFSGTLKAAEASTTGAGTSSTGTSARTTTDYSRVPGTRAVPPPVTPTPPKSTVVHTPVGIFDLANMQRPVVDVNASSELEAYFMTHAPGEWSKDPMSRAAFAKIYGNTALAVLDATGKVPKNMEQVWVAPTGTTRSA